PILPEQRRKSLGVRTKFLDPGLSSAAQPMIASPGGPAIQANNLNVAQPSALVSAQPVSQIEPRQHLFKAARSFGIGVDYRVEVGSRHVDVAQGVIQDAGPIESVDFSAEPPASVQRGGPAPDSA